MREILFKAKRIDNGEWVEGNLIITPKADEDFKTIIIPFDDNNEYTEGVNDSDLGFETWYKVDITTICQYTGLTDKNGNKIWENDIVILGEDLYIVDWEEDDAMFALEYVGIVEHFGNIDSKWCEVAGNKFDNPELLEGSEL